METTKLKRFAQYARVTLMETVTTKLDFVLAEESSARREYPDAVMKLEEEINNSSKEQVIEKVAYIWFNRFIALRFMDVNRYTKLNIVSPEPGQFQPSILADAKMGHIDDALVSESVREKILALLENRTPSSDPQGEAYKLLVVAACNYYSYAMPFLFERIADYTELLMPDDLLSGDSILSYVRETMTPDVCKDVEVIGWLYQFYISEKKDLVFEGLKKNKKVTPENIPAATQLFTPHWIVQYMVENSLGRLWVLNNPNSKLIKEDSEFKMEYYIKPETPEEDYLKISSPTELKICDPACGSGHILVYAFDLLFEIYKEAGYTDDDDILESILKHNLYGIEIDERAAELAAFALAMKAASRSGSKRRFFRKPIEVNVCKLEAIKFSDEEIENYMDAVGRNLFTTDLQTTLKQFEEADNFGSLIQPAVKDVTSVLEILKGKDVSHDLFLVPTHKKVLQVLEQADYLSQKYHVVVANPPYMGNKGINGRLGVFLKENFEDVKMDLFSAFVVRCGMIGVLNAHIGIMSPNTWMYISSYKKLRYYLLKQRTLTNLVELPLTGFKGATVQICSYTFMNSRKKLDTSFIRLVKFKGGDAEMSELTRKAINNKNVKYFYYLNVDKFDKIPSSPIAYWISDKEINLYSTGELLSNVSSPRKGLDTGENNKFLRLWQELSINKINFYNQNINAKWYPYNKGGDFRKWYGNREYVINWFNNGEEIKSRLSWKKKKPTIRNERFYFKEGFTWTTVSSSGFSARYTPKGALFDNGGCTLFAEKNLDIIGAYLNSSVMNRYLEFISPTLNFQPGDISRVLFFKSNFNLNVSAAPMIEIAKKDWNSYEISWDFKLLPLFQNNVKSNLLKESYNKLKLFWQTQIDEMQRLEEKNNKFFINAHNLEKEVDPEVILKEVTLTCNPYYRYDAKKSKEELDALQLADTMKEYISYAVGVMFGRYSLDHEGLHIADTGISLEEVNEKFNILNPTFEADADNVIPILDGDWFTDDISERFLQFVKVTFGKEHYEENIDFIANALKEKNTNSIETIRKYFVKDFYADHIKRYKKRPIYWLFSSPKGSFQALIYMHRYQSDTVSIILNDYLKNFITKLEATRENLEAVSISTSATKSEKITALKEIEKIKKILIELEEYEREILYPLATKKIKIDLDKGVKYNYPLFENALKKVTGLS